MIRFLSFLALLRRPAPTAEPQHPMLPPDLARQCDASRAADKTRRAKLFAPFPYQRSR